jgi:hypothetical protein
LADRITSGYTGDVPLTDPPADWLDGAHHPLEAIRLQPSNTPAERIEFQRQHAVLVISGTHAELARIVGGSIDNLADAPYRMTEGSVPTHLHLDPTSDPERRWYSEKSISLVVNLAAED